MDLIYWDHYYDKALIGNLIVVITLFVTMRWFSGMIERIDTSSELLIKDNPAFGISVAGKILGIAIMLSGMIFGGNVETLYSIAAVFLTGASGIFFMAVAHFIFKKITLSQVAVRDEVVRGNKAVALADTGNIIAAAIILRAITQWMPPQDIQGAGAFVAAFLIAQILFTLVTVIKIKAFNVINKDNSLVDELKKGNVAVALGFAGRKIGSAFAIALATNIIAVESAETGRILFTLFWVSGIALIAFEALCSISKRVVLYGVDIRNEIIGQRNIALGSLQAVIYISLGYLLSQF